MKKEISLSTHTLPIYWIIGTIFYTTFLNIVAPYNFSFIEQMNTFIYDNIYISSRMYSIGGCATLVADWLVQFFRTPIIGIVITATLLSTITTLFAIVLQRISSKNHLTLLSSLPVVALMLLHFNVNCLYSGIVAFLFMAIFLVIECYISNFSWRYIFSVASVILLYLSAGPIALLYSIILFTIEMFYSPRKGILYLTAPLIVITMAYVCLHLGLAGEWKHLLLPDAYFTLRLEGGSSLFLPWSITVAVFIIGAAYRFITLKNNVAVYILCIAEISAVVTFLYTNTSKYVNRDNEIYKELNYLTRHEMWDDIITRCKKLPMTNILHQNYLNMALAEKGQLFDELRNFPNIGTESLLIPANKNPYISTLLSDIYYSMGHIAFSRRYAFEANESAGGYSPKLLQRLTLTSIIYNENDLAIKYISLLEKTLFYNDWAQQMRAYIQGKGNEIISSTIENKKRCIFPDNRFSGSEGLDQDLKDIINNNPTHTATIEYLKAINLFLGTK